MVDVVAGYVRRLTGRRGVLRDAARALAREAGTTVAAAAEAVALAGAALPCALARHATRRGAGVAAAAAVLAKFGRDADLGAPDIGVVSAWRSPRLDPRLGGLLGDDADRLAAWLATRTRAPAPVLARIVAASAPLVLGALTDAASSPNALADLLARFPPEALAEPHRFDARGTVAGAVFARTRRAAGPSVWRRILFVGR